MVKSYETGLDPSSSPTAPITPPLSPILPLPPSHPLSLASLTPSPALSKKKRRIGQPISKGQNQSEPGFEQENESELEQELVRAIEPGMETSNGSRTYPGTWENHNPSDMREREKRLIGENGRRRLFVPAKDVDVNRGEERTLSDEDGEDATLIVEQADDEDSGDETFKEFEMDATDL